MRELSPFGFQEAAPRRCASEEISHLDGSAFRVGRRTHVTAIAVDHIQGIGIDGTRRPGDQPQARDRGNTRQGFAAKSQGRHASQIIQTGDLAGRMPGQGEGEFVAGNTDPVIPNAAQANPGVFQFNFYPPGTGIQAVFQQFLNHGSRAFDHLTGGDLVNKLGWQLANGHAGILSERPADLNQLQVPRRTGILKR
jgi:hypothetical protein